jgi:N-carbamoyl-L-amino-acid hydrolase
MQRRKFIKQSSLTLAGIGVFGSLLSNNRINEINLSVNGKRIESRIFELAKFGVDEKGRGFRVAYSKGDIEGRAWFMELMKKAGLNPSIDAAGNMHLVHILTWCPMAATTMAHSVQLLHWN